MATFFCPQGGRRKEVQPCYRNVFFLFFRLAQQVRRVEGWRATKTHQGEDNRRQFSNTHVTLYCSGELRRSSFINAQEKLNGLSVLLTSSEKGIITYK